MKYDRHARWRDDRDWYQRRSSARSRTGMALRLLIVACVVASCGGDAAASEDASLAESQRGVLQLAHELSWGGDESLDPASTAPMNWATALVFDGLVTVGPRGEAEPHLAHSWRSNDDATVWTFELTEGVLFHDGTSFGAEDVKATFERIPGSGSPLAGALSALERVEVIDPLTAAFHFSKRSVDFPLLLTDRRMRVLSSELTEEIGTGPFALAVFDPANTTVLDAFDDYWQGPPGLAGIEIVAMPDADSRIAAVESGRLHVLDNIGVGEVEQLLGRADFSIQQVPSGDWRGIAFDTRAEPYDDARVREALKLVVDRTEMIELVAGGDLGAEVSCDTPVWSSDPYYVADTCEQDIERARELLADAGYPDGIDISISTSRLYSDWVPMVEVFQYQAARAGIRVDIVVADAEGYWTDVWMQDPAVTTHWTQRTAEQVLNEGFLSSAPWNETFWENEEFDTAVETASSEADPRRRAALYEDAQRILKAESGTIIPYHVKASRVVRSRVVGIADGISRYTIPWHEVTLTAEQQG